MQSVIHYMVGIIRFLSLYMMVYYGLAIILALPTMHVKEDKKGRDEKGKVLDRSMNLVAISVAVFVLTMIYGC